MRPLSYGYWATWQGFLFPGCGRGIITKGSYHDYEMKKNSQKNSSLIEENGENNLSRLISVRVG